MALSKKNTGKQRSDGNECTDFASKPETPRLEVKLVSEVSEGLVSQKEHNTRVRSSGPSSQSISSGNNHNKLRSSIAEIEPPKRANPTKTPLAIDTEGLKQEFSAGNSSSICKSPGHDAGSIMGIKRECHLTFAPIRTNSGNSKDLSLGDYSPVLAESKFGPHTGRKANMMTTSLTPQIGSTGVIGSKMAESAGRFGPAFKMGSQDLEIRKDSLPLYTKNAVKLSQGSKDLFRTDEVCEEENSSQKAINTSRKGELQHGVDYAVILPSGIVKTNASSHVQTEEDVEDPDYNTPTLDPFRKTSRESSASLACNVESGPMPPRSFDQASGYVIRQKKGYVRNLVDQLPDPEGQILSNPELDMKRSSYLELSTGSPAVSLTKPIQSDSKLDSNGDVVLAGDTQVGRQPVRMDTVHFGGPQAAHSEQFPQNPKSSKVKRYPSQPLDVLLDQGKAVSDKMLNQPDPAGHKGSLALCLSFGPDDFAKILKGKDGNQASNLTDSKRSIHKPGRRSTFSGVKPADSDKQKSKYEQSKRIITPNPFLQQATSENDASSDEAQSKFSEVTEMKTVDGGSPLNGIESVPREILGARFRIPVLQVSPENSEDREVRRTHVRNGPNSAEGDLQGQEQNGRHTQLGSESASKQNRVDGTRHLLPLILSALALCVFLFEVISSGSISQTKPAG